MRGELQGECGVEGGFALASGVAVRGSQEKSPVSTDPLLESAWPEMAGGADQRFEARSMRTISEFSCSRSNTILLPSGVTSNVRITAGLLN